MRIGDISLFACGALRLIAHVARNAAAWLRGVQRWIDPQTAEFAGCNPSGDVPPVRNPVRGDTDAGFTLGIPGEILGRVRAALESLGWEARSGEDPRGIEAETFLRILDWAGVQLPQTLRAICVRDTDLGTAPVKTGAAPERTMRDYGPGRAELAARHGMLVRFGRQYFTLTPAGRAPLPLKPVEFDASEREFLRGFAAELDADFEATPRDRRDAADGVNGRYAALALLSPGGAILETHKATFSAGVNAVQFVQMIEAAYRGAQYRLAILDLNEASVASAVVCGGLGADAAGLAFRAIVEACSKAGMFEE